MNEPTKKRPFLDIADVVFTIGALMVIAGSALFDWRLTLMITGFILVVGSMARLNRIDRS